MCTLMHLSQYPCRRADNSPYFSGGGARGEGMKSPGKILKGVRDNSRATEADERSSMISSERTRDCARSLPGTTSSSPLSSDRQRIT